MPSRDHIELPFQAAGIGRRFCAGLVDCAVVVAAAGVFGAIAYKLLPKIEPTKPLLLTAAMLSRPALGSLRIHAGDVCGSYGRHAGCQESA